MSWSLIVIGGSGEILRGLAETQTCTGSFCRRLKSAGVYLAATSKFGRVVREAY